MAEIENLNVLIVDDHFLTRQVVADALRQLNISKITMVGDGNAARETLLTAHKAGQPFDVVYLDHNLPHLVGIEVLRQMRALPEFQRTAFIMLTSETDREIVMQAAKAGACGYLIKPVALHSITRKMNEAVVWISKQKVH